MEMKDIAKDGCHWRRQRVTGMNERDFLSQMFWNHLNIEPYESITYL